MMPNLMSRMRIGSGLFMVCIAILCTITACNDGVPMVGVGLDESYTISRMQWLRLKTDLAGEQYVWKEIDGHGVSKVLSTSSECRFISAVEGDFTIVLEITDGDVPFLHECAVHVVHEEVEYSPYISQVYEYKPAPGQFVNVMPIWEKGDVEADMVRKAGEAICGTMDELVSLGAYGGYITFGFDHTVVNVEGENDFMVLGNAFYEEGLEAEQTGSCEPGIVMVSIDVNGNGIPDDPWYELAGSEYVSASTIKNYGITYRRPDPAKPAVPQGQYILDAEYVPWRDSEGATGYVAKNFQHTQSYYPQWEVADELHFVGSRLADNAVDVYGNGLYFQLHAMPWGYVDNHPNVNSELNSFDIANAVDSYGMPVFLPGVDFVRVYTALNQYCNWIGETSTEISGGRDLHVLND